MGTCSHAGEGGACATCGDTKTQEEQALARTLRNIRHKILVMSGKGGVGKSSVAVSLALALARRGFTVGLMDVDIHGPNVLRMLGLKDPFDLTSGQFPLPPEIFHNLKVISIEVLMRNRDLAVIWRGPLKHQLIRQFLTEVQWGFLDYLVIDAPPGTGDEPMSVAQTIPEARPLIVTTPQEISLADVRKSIDFCQKVNMQMLGIVENMSGYACPHCGKDLPLFKKGGGERTAQAAGVPFLGSLPFDPRVVEAADQGQLLALAEEDTAFFQGLRPIVSYIEKVLPPKPAREPGVSIFAVPVADGQVAPKFSLAPQFALITVKNGAIQGKQMLDTPPEIAELPAWLESLNVSHVLAGDLGEGPREVLKKKGIEVITEVAAGDPEALVLRYAG